MGGEANGKGSGAFRRSPCLLASSRSPAFGFASLLPASLQASLAPRWETGEGQGGRSADRKPKRLALWAPGVVCGFVRHAGRAIPACSAPGSWLLFIQVELARVKGPLKFPRLSTPRPSGPSRERPGRWRQGFGVGVGGGGTTPMHPLSFNGLLSEISSSQAQFSKGWEYPLGPK